MTLCRCSGRTASYSTGRSSTRSSNPNPYPNPNPNPNPSPNPNPNPDPDLNPNPNEARDEWRGLLFADISARSLF